MKSQLPSLSNISSQGDRIAALLRQTAAQKPEPSWGDIASSTLSAYANSANPRVGAFNAYTDTMQTRKEEAQQQKQNMLNSEKDIYDYMVKAKQLGDDDTARMKEGLDTLVGQDPMKQMQIIKYVKEKYPGMSIDSGNYLQPALEAVQTLGLKNDDLVFKKRQQDLTLQNLQAGLDYKKQQMSAAQQATTNGQTPVFNREFEKQRAKADAQKMASMQQNLEGAQSFLDKVAAVEQTLNEVGSDTGPLQGSAFGQSIGGILNTNAQQKRDLLAAQIADLELDIAKMKLKGQGQITESERAIARATLPKLTNNPEANMAILDNLKREASGILRGTQGTPPSATTTTPQRLRFNPATGGFE